MMASDDQHPPQQVQQLRRELQGEQQQDQKMGPLFVTFPRPVPKVQSLKLEPEKGQEEPQSRSMVQAYIMGAYLIARWAWARFQERQSRRKSGGQG
jgi:hypothetical protein